MMRSRFVVIPLILGATVRATGASLDDLPRWTGEGTNRAALVIQWRAPEVRENSAVPNPILETCLAWGFRWNGTANAEDMFNAVVAADPRLFALVNSTRTYGKAVLGLGYDFTNNHVLGLRDGTNLIVSRAFVNGLIVAPEFGAADRFLSLDPTDLYWGGWVGPGWELWHDRGVVGGLIDAPSRGPDPYWTPDDPARPYTGNHGQWHLADAGMNGIRLKDGSWVAWTVSAGGYNLMTPDAPGTVAWRQHKQAPAIPVAAPAPSSPFASRIVSATAPFGAAPYDDPASVLGPPAGDFFDPFAEFSGRTAIRLVTIVEAPINVDGGQKGKLLTTLEDSSGIVVGFDEPIVDDPAHPYGIDLLIFGNAFYPASGAVDDDSNFNNLMLGGGIFAEPAKVSVSPGYTGQTGENPEDPRTWPWFRYEAGPYADTGFPTQARRWDRERATWTEQPMDFTKPVNPVFTSRLENGGITVADALDLYLGSGGGTGFDLAASGFSSVRFVRLEGISPDWMGGDIDAISRVRPMRIGESLTVAPENLVGDGASLYFQQPGDAAAGAVQLEFHTLSEGARIDTSRVEDLSGAPVQTAALLVAANLAISPLVGSNAVHFLADLKFAAGAAYDGSGDDLDVWQRHDTTWVPAAFTFDPSSKAVVVSGVTHLTAYLVTREGTPNFEILWDGPGHEFRCVPMLGWKHTLERSTDFEHWVPIDSITPGDETVITFRDPEPPVIRAFYRLQRSRP